MITIILGICGLVVEVLLLSGMDLFGAAEQYNGVRLLFWFGVSGSAVRDFLQLKRYSSIEQSYKKQLLHHSRELAQLSEDLAQKEEATEKLEEQLQVAEASQNQKLIDLQQSLKIAEGRAADTERKFQSLEANSGEDSVVMLLSTLQKQGRFLDFVMNDISQLPDERVGAGARIVHQGCQETIKKYFDIEPIHQDAEGSTVAIDSEAPESQYRIHGATSEELPDSAKLLHRGWKTNKVALPKFVKKDDGTQRILAPAEIQI